MKLVLDEKVKLNYSFIKRVEEEALMLLPDEFNFLENDIRLYVMLSMVNELSVDGLNELLAEEGDIIDKIEITIEPFFEEAISNRPEIKDKFDYITQDICNFMKGRQEDNRHFVNRLDGLFEVLGQFKPEDIQHVFTDFIKDFPIDKLTNSITSNTSTEEKQEDIDNIDDIKNEKLKEMIQKFEKEKTA